MLKTMMLIVNPFSGRGRVKLALYKIVELFCRAGYVVNIYLTGGEHSAEQLSELYSNNFDLVVCVGGDGTLSDVVSGMMKTAAPPPIGYIPMGTANDMATTLALSRQPAKAVMSVINGQPVALDIGEYSGGFFTYIAAFGAFTEVSYSTPQRAKRALGHLAYVLRGINSVSTIKPRHTIVEYDGGLIEDNFIFGGVTNSTSVAGLVKLDPKDVALSDGLFEVVLVKQPITLNDFRTIIDDIAKHNFHSENVRLLHTHKVKFTFDTEVEWTRDGENGGRHKTIEIVNRGSAIKLIL